MARPSTTRLLIVALAHIALPMFPNVADAAVITVQAATASKFAATGQHNHPFDTNYLVGNIPFVGTYRNFFVFDLTAFPGDQKVTAATLVLQQPILGHLSPDATETYQLFDVTTPAAQLQTFYPESDPAGIAIYADLGAGVNLGSVNLGESSEQTNVSINLLAAAFPLINAAKGSFFSIGGALTTLAHGPEVDERTFGFTGDTSTHFLRLTTVTVPELSSIVCMGCALSALVGSYLRRRMRSRP